MTDQPTNATPKVSIEAVLDNLASRVGQQARDAAIADTTVAALQVDNEQLRARVAELEQQLQQAQAQTVAARPMPPESPGEEGQQQ